MRIKDIKVYEEWKSNNTDEYGACTFRYAERWADLMERELDNGAHIKYIAKDLSHKADTECITGFMYGASVSILSKCWEYGEELRKWHNGEYDYEGNWVVNPAVAEIKIKQTTF